MRKRRSSLRQASRRCSFRRSLQTGSPLADVLQSFMEESNIRWGEIIAGLLIVRQRGRPHLQPPLARCKAIPYSPAILFMLFTLGFYGAGMYTLRRWKLHAISRVILIISLLLVPLSFAAAIVMSGPARQAARSDGPAVHRRGRCRHRRLQPGHLFHQPRACRRRDDGG